METKRVDPNGLGLHRYIAAIFFQALITFRYATDQPDCFVNVWLPSHIPRIEPFVNLVGLGREIIEAYLCEVFVHVVRVHLLNTGEVLCAHFFQSR